MSERNIIQQIFKDKRKRETKSIERNQRVREYI